MGDWESISAQKKFKEQVLVKKEAENRSDDCPKMWFRMEQTQQ